MGALVTPTAHALHDSEACHSSVTRYCSIDVSDSLKLVTQCQGDQTSSYAESTMNACKIAQFHHLINKALDDPKILHYIRVAIITDAHLLKFPIDNSHSECHYHSTANRYNMDVTFHVSLDPSVHDFARIQERIFAPFSDSDSDIPSPEELEFKLASSEELTNLNLYNGSLYFRCGLSSSSSSAGPGNVDFSRVAKLQTNNLQLNSERHAQIEGPQAASTSASRSNGCDEPLNPIVIAHWCWSGSPIWVTNVIEITPEAICDARSGFISESMRLDIDSDYKDNDYTLPSGPFKIPSKDGRSGLLGIVNEFIKNKKSSSLTAKMTNQDFQVILDMIKSAHTAVWERFKRVGTAAFNV